MVGFCGNSSFWDKEALLNNWWPQFTDCFQETVLTFAPCGWLWLTCIPHLIYLKRHRRYIELPISWLTVLKLIFSPTLCILHLVHIAAASEEFGPDLSPSFYLCKGLWAVTCALACGLILVSQKHGVASPCILFIFWTLSLTVSVIPVYSGAILQEYNGKLLSYFIVCLILLFVVLEFLLHCCNEKHVVHLQNSHFQRPCSEAGASFPSKLIYSWVFKEIYKGYKKPLELRDVVDMPHYMHSTNIVPQFLSTWKKELVHTQLKNRHLDPRPNGCLNADLREGSSAEVDDDEQTPLLSASVGFVQQARRKPKKASLYKVLLKIFWLPYLKVQFIGIMADCLVFVNTLLLNEIILYVEHKKDYPQWQGFIIAFSFLVVTLLNSMMINHKVYKTWNIGIKIKTMLMAAVYKKALTMNAESRRKFTVGTIVNLMSVDCAKFQDLLMSAWVVFSFPVSMSISFYLLHDALGLAFITGIVILVLFIPVITKISSLIKKAQAEQLKIKDKRIKLTNEVLNGIKVLKLYAWEPSFDEQVRNTRGLELVQLRKAALYISFATLSWFISPVMVTVLTFLTYILISPENALTPAKAFVAMNIFNYIRVPINVLPMLVTQVAQVHVSGKRLCDFFCGEDLEETDREGADEEHPVVMRGATFTWDKTLPPTLKNLTLEIPKGKLVAVVGQVGSGKSSLVSALLGEMQKERGQLSVKGSVAYVAQQAWIQNMTLRDNILFEKAMTTDRYYQIVDACALRPDIELLPAGEMTEIGEKGINLSGGQKQRVSLARAAYSDADLYLLDDPLSAVDAHVGRHIFEQVLGPNGLLGKKTRILVTHGIHWLPLTDHIIVMDQGRITESGSYQQLMNHDGPFAEFVKTYLVEHADDEINDEEVGKLTDQIIAQVGTVISEELPDDTKKKLLRTRSHHSQSSATGSEKSMTDKEGEGSARGKSENKSQTASTSQGQDRLIEEETSETGKIRGAVLMAVIRAFGVVSAALVPLCLVAYQGLNVGTGIWLSQWTDDPFLRNESNSHMHTYRSKTYFYLGVYSALNGLQVFGNGAFILIVFLHFVHASRHLHNHMLTNILHQAMAFFDTTPVGRILNRFSRDMDIIDTLFPHLVRITLHNIFQLMAIVVVISYSTPIFLAVAVPIFLLYVVLQVNKGGRREAIGKIFSWLDDLFRLRFVGLCVLHRPAFVPRI
ncbi:canalicular multispecific organic anion transporter 2 [Aplysia californica]|uniref:Canalicular multispecific organic anion transporter 2 n=1 Tax=Aplysia californica TaxID=6500 RepID=A0ABM1A665_APLCA|nr:canalicular multispecific organic anion transporter 2 [Aplysia californica]